MLPEDLGQNLIALRKQRGLSLRKVCLSANLSPASLSAIETGRSSPTLASLHRILKALGTSFAEFFGGPEDSQPASPVFPAHDMKRIEDAHRTYVMAIGRRPELRFEVFCETIRPTEKKSEWETHDFDVGGMILQGGPMRLEIEGQGKWKLNKGDAYYIRAGLRHRATNLGRKPLRQITVVDPPRY
jgi:transcriptional regulator with XRE-family HTH domain